MDVQTQKKAKAQYRMQKGDVQSEKQDGDTRNKSHWTYASQKGHEPKMELNEKQDPKETEHWPGAQGRHVAISDEKIEQGPDFQTTQQLIQLSPHWISYWDALSGPDRSQGWFWSWIREDVNH